MQEITISQIDIEHLGVIRKNVIDFMKVASSKYALLPGKLLDIAPQVHEGAKPYFSSSILIETFDIDPNSGCTYIGDICNYNDFLQDNTYDYIVCTEVLEHTLRPWDAVNEIYRILKPGGILFATTPFDFRIHGPLPDCWRFTEHGLRSLFHQYTNLEIYSLTNPERALMPIHYTIIARKPVMDDSQDSH